MTYLTQYGLLTDDASRVAQVHRWLATDAAGLFAELRADRPVFEIPGITLLTRSVDVLAALADQESFTVRPYAEAMDAVAPDFMLARDDQRSRDEKQAMLAALGADPAGRLRTLAGELTEQALAAARQRGYLDVVPDLGRHVPERLCAELFGITAPDDDPGAVLRWSRATQEDVFRNPARDAALHDLSREAGRQLDARLQALVTQRRTRAGFAPAPDDVLGRLLAADGRRGVQAGVQAGPREVAVDRIPTNLTGLVVGSIETISQAVVQVLEHLLLHHPERGEAARQAARSAPDELPGHVWEALRFAPITPLLRRYCTRDVPLPSGGTVRAGRLVYVCTASAMFDPDAVEDPAQFRPSRGASRLHFGSGPHTCLGRSLAEQVVPEVVLRVLRQPDVAPLPPPVGLVDTAGGAFQEHFLLAVGPRTPQVPRAYEPGPRATERDGLRNQVEFLLTTSFPAAWGVIQRRPRLRRALNRYLIDSAALRMPPRPNPLSTLAPYTSWHSLTDRTHDGRHLPPAAAGELPDLDRVTALFARPPGAGLTGEKSTLLFAYFAQWFTDGFLRGDHRPGRPPGTNTSSHEIDLCQLYGATPEVTGALREHGDGERRGRLRSRLIGGEELPPLLCVDGAPAAGLEAVDDLGLQPGSGTDPARLLAFGSDRANAQIGLAMLNTLFLREHNRVAGLIAGAHRDWDDERVFQTTRNVLVVELIQIVVSDYIGAIAPHLFRFSVDPAAFPNPRWHRQNWMAVEFDLLYRWHSLLPTSVQLGGRPVPVQRTVFAQDLLGRVGLRSLLAEAAAQPAGRIGLFNTDSTLLPVERASLALGRAVQLQGYNAYREAVGIPRATQFSQISGDRRVQEGLRDVYGSVDRIELYAGLFAEDLRANSVLPPLMGRMVALDAFSQALTNPLLAPRVHLPGTFSDEGWAVLQATRTLSDVVERNTAGAPARFGFVRADWHRTR